MPDSARSFNDSIPNVFALHLLSIRVMSNKDPTQAPVP